MEGMGSQRGFFCLGECNRKIWHTNAKVKRREAHAFQNLAEFWSGCGRLAARAGATRSTTTDFSHDYSYNYTRLAVRVIGWGEIRLCNSYRAGFPFCDE